MRGQQVTSPPPAPLIEFRPGNQDFKVFELTGRALRLNCPHFTDAEPEAEAGCDLSKVTQRVRARGKAGAGTFSQEGLSRTTLRMAGWRAFGSGHGATDTKSKLPARTYTSKRLSFPYLGGLARARGALPRWDGTPDVTGTETAPIPISHRRTGSAA